MSNLEKAMAILNSPVTVEALNELDALCASSRGDEAERIADLWEAALVQASQDVIDDYHAAELGVA
ncbi:hypothetical protein VVYB158_15420 [Vibrio vulnificus CladeA-yb158]|uniref:hypothetical protein n=1 Tax=Vibrio TaxID=662 RepID=UPI00063D966B|nr:MULTISPECIES: hypothetical protein [Vibrio]EGQ9150151.1 hypothetical protein [Vibrio parahaemolyticus]KLI66960.1 hypothetical protein VVYB158_15420 [Vibrio vulnificus CladeA-yb158]MBE3696747.1 hypothetical protein [Vibrio parahaemolyticus]MBE3775884.1 hypothetical protein [Vibrio parahaemolyticus]MBN8107751.1 hypothetical protein [Vibrio vulnificus]